MSIDLYYDPIIEWAKRKEHMGTLDKADCRATENNSLCGDLVNVEIKLHRNQIIEIAFHVRGCILVRAAAAHLGFLATGLDLETLRQLKQNFGKALKAKEKEILFPESHEFFSPVRSRKSRHSCVLLPYDAAMRALASMSAEESVHHVPTLSREPIPSKFFFQDGRLNGLALPSSASELISYRPKQPSRASL